MLLGAVELDGDGCNIGAVRTSLLPSLLNPRRALLQTVTLSSDHKHCTDFLVAIGTEIFCSKTLSKEDVAWLKRRAAPNLCTDYVVVGNAEVEDESDALNLDAVRNSLLPSLLNPRRALLQPFTLSSDHKRCTHFFLRSEEGLRCSTDLTSADVLWLEACAGLERGKLFEAIRRSAAAPPSPTELPWEPQARYHALARLERTPKGAKSVEHEENLRRSNPTSSARPQRERLATCVATAHAAPSAPKSSGRAAREERKSADSVISYLDERDMPRARPSLKPRSPSSVLDANGPATATGAWSLEKSQGSELVKSKAGPRSGGPAKPAEEALWFQGVKYVKSANGENGYSSS